MDDFDDVLDLTTTNSRRLTYEEAKDVTKPVKRRNDLEDDSFDFLDSADRDMKKRKTLGEKQSSQFYSKFSLAEPCVQVTGGSGERVYVRLKPEKNIPKFTLKPGQLLSTPISYLIDKIYDEDLKAQHSQSTLPEEVRQEDIPKFELWVDKYSPKKFTDLLSDEQTNRKLLQWLVTWQAKFGTGSVKSSSKQTNKNWKESDKDFKKILLLCGPPGTGKTTLAHVIASHAGYNAIEINASDDRSGDAFSSKVLNAIEMQTNWMGDNKPNCLIIDEIDGITDREGKGAVDVLVNLVNGFKKSKKKKDSENNNDNNNSNNNSKNETPKLSRPIICICNNQYVPVLKKLRAVATVYNFEKPKSSKLVQRLKEICTKEGMIADNHSLSTLVDITDCDIRSSLNSLQFLRNKMRTITSEALSSYAVGHKDMGKNIFEIWKEIFSAPNKKRPTHRVKQKKSFEGNTSPTYEHFESLYASVEDSDIQRVIDGCYENYLSVHFTDPMMGKTLDCLHWLEFSDMVDKSIYQEQSFGLHKFQNAVPMAFHKMCGTSSLTPNITFPTNENQFRTKHSNMSDLLHSFLNDCDPFIYASLSPKIVATELVSYLLDIVSSVNLRSVNSQLFNTKEKEELTNIVGMMVSYGLSYVKKEDSDNYSLDPPLEQVTSFTSYTKQRKVLSNVVQHMIVQEIHKEEARRVMRTPSAPSLITPSQELPKPTVPNTTKPSSPIITSTKGMKVVSVPVEVKDIFGRTITVKSKSPLKEANTTKPMFKFKFHEGTTDAVRRTVHMKHFFS